MAVKASVTITISKYRDINSIIRYYKLQASTAAAPAVPTTLTPSGWSTSEPTYTSGSTNTLYYTDCIIFSDGTFQYTDDGNGKAVKSSSYEAAKEAYNKAQAAQNSINNMEIGGRNYIINSNFYKGKISRTFRCPGWTYGTGSDLSTDVKHDGHNTIHRHRTGTTSMSWAEMQYYYYRDLTKVINQDEVWTLSFYVYVDESDWLDVSTNIIASAIRIYDSSNTKIKEISLKDLKIELKKAIGKWFRVVQTFTIPASCDYSYFYFFNSPSRDYDYYVSDYKLERGNKSTDWTPAPEDLDDTINSVINLYYASDSSTPPSKPSAHVTTNNASTRGQWNIALPTYNEDYPYLYTCKELLNEGGTYSWTTVEQSTYAEAAKEIQDGLESIQADYVTNTMFTSYQRDQVENDQGIKTRLERTEVSIYGELNYELLTVQPADWTTDYTKYYVIVDNEYVSVSGDSAPTWQPNTYYELPVDPNSLTNKIQQIDNDINGENGLDNRLEIAEDTLDSTGLNDLDRRVTITQRFLNVETDVEQIKNIFKITGGNNLIQNSVGYFSSSGNKPSMWNIADNTIYSPFGYDGDLTGVTVSRGKLTCAKGSMVTTQNNIIALITNKVMSISFKYRNGANATSKIKVYNGSITLFEKTFNTTVNEWTDYSFNPDTDPEIANPTFGCPFSSLQISIESTNTANNNGIEISDLMLNYGDVKPWELCNNEVYGAMVKLSSLGIEVTSTTANTKNFMTTDGILVFAYDASTDSIVGSEPITKITDNGTLTNKLESTGDIIERNLINTMITDSSNNDIYVEYIR